jgi:hypothetical protein
MKKKLPQLFDFICSHGTGYPAERYQKATMSVRPCRGHAFAELGDNQDEISLGFYLENRNALRGRPGLRLFANADFLRKRRRDMGTRRKA